jgi:hypothetical protein
MNQHQRQQLRGGEACSAQLQAGRKRRNFLLRKIIAPAAVVAALIAGPAVAGNGNGAPSGPHYNLNIIGVENPKTAKLTGSDRHTIFMPLYSTKNNGQISHCADNGDGGTLSGSCTAIVDNPIWLIPGADFQVCDGNGFDPAYDCSGQQIDSKIGAVFSLPCNTDITMEDLNYGCDPTLPSASYTVWARAVGQPGGYAVATTCATVNDLDTTVSGGGDLYCSEENVTDPLMRKNGQPIFQNVTDELTSLLLLYCDTGFLPDGTCADPVKRVRVALFASGTEDWFWNYDNNGLRLAQLRFYLND